MKIVDESILLPESHLRVQPRVSASLHNLEHFFTLSHSLPLHDSHLNTGLLISKIQANLARNKANKIIDKIQPYNLPLWLFRDKTLKQTLNLIYELGTVKQNSLLTLEFDKLLNHMNKNILKHNNTVSSLYVEKLVIAYETSIMQSSKME